MGGIVVGLLSNTDPLKTIRYKPDYYRTFVFPTKKEARKKSEYLTRTIRNKKSNCIHFTKNPINHNWPRLDGTV